jgi:enoyl-[acyl-carrier protein] reductase III
MSAFNGKNYMALILGGSAGIGLATAKKLASEGMHMCIIYRGRKADAKIVEDCFDKMKREFGIEILSLNADVNEKETMQSVIQKISEFKQFKIRLLLHSISKGNLKPLVKPKVKDYQNDVYVLNEIYQNLIHEQAKFQNSEFFLEAIDYQLTINNMALNIVDWIKILFQNNLFYSDARILGLSSEGNKKSWINYGAVSAAKAALEAIFKSIALEYAPYGIRANIIQAGITDTESLRRIPGSDYLKANAKFRNPFNRLTSVEDVANVIYLLCRDEAAWINGAVIPVDGGESIC